MTRPCSIPFSFICRARGSHWRASLPPMRSCPRDRIGRVDCVVADVRMPGLSGLDLVRHLACHETAPPIVLITGHGDIDMAVAAIKLGADDFIEKPFDEARLLESIHKDARSEEGRVGKECGSTCRSGWSPNH